VKAIAYASVIGPKGRNGLTPSNEARLLSTYPFDVTASAPDKLRMAARNLHGIMSRPEHWKKIAEYRVIDACKQRHRPRYDVVLVYEFMPEREMRKHLGIADNTLDPFSGESWYLERVSDPIT